MLPTVRLCEQAKLPRYIVYHTKYTLASSRLLVNFSSSKYWSVGRNITTNSGISFGYFSSFQLPGLVVSKLQFQNKQQLIKLFALHISQNIFPLNRFLNICKPCSSKDKDCIKVSDLGRNVCLCPGQNNSQIFDRLVYFSQKEKNVKDFLHNWCAFHLTGSTPYKKKVWIIWHSDRDIWQNRGKDRKFCFGAFNKLNVFDF